MHSGANVAGGAGDRSKTDQCTASVTGRTYIWLFAVEGVGGARASVAG